MPQNRTRHGRTSERYPTQLTVWHVILFGLDRPDPSFAMSLNETLSPYVGDVIAFIVILLFRIVYR